MMITHRRQPFLFKIFLTRKGLSSFFLLLANSTAQICWKRWSLPPAPEWPKLQHGLKRLHANAAGRAIDGHCGCADIRYTAHAAVGAQSIGAQGNFRERKVPKCIGASCRDSCPAVVEKRYSGIG